MWKYLRDKKNKFILPVTNKPVIIKLSLNTIGSISEIIISVAISFFFNKKLILVYLGWKGRVEGLV